MNSNAANNVLMYLPVTFVVQICGRSKGEIQTERTLWETDMRTVCKGISSEKAYNAGQ